MQNEFVRAKKRGQPPTGKEVQIVVRMQPASLRALDAWLANQPDRPTRPEAIRRLVELALAVEGPPKIPVPATRQRDRAAFLAAATLDKHSDATATEEERGSRRTRLLKGPSSFRDVRKD